MFLLVQIHKNGTRKLIKFASDDEMKLYDQSLDIKILTHCGKVEEAYSFLQGYESFSEESLEKVKMFVSSEQKEIDIDELKGWK